MTYFVSNFCSHVDTDTIPTNNNATANTLVFDFVRNGNDLDDAKYCETNNFDYCGTCDGLNPDPLFGNCGENNVDCPDIDCNGVCFGKAFIDYCEEMPVAYRIANLVCSCSYEPESFGRVAVEAQSMGIPIVASNIGGSTETIVKDKTGFLFKSGDSKELTKTIIMIMGKSYNSLKSVGFEGRKNVLKKFDVDKMCYTTFTEYKKLIELS